MAKVGIIGAGFVGATAAYAMMLNGTCSEIVLIDRDEPRARAEAADIAHGAPLAKGVRAYAGDYKDLTGAALVVIAAGSNQKPGESRLNLLSRNAAILASIVPQVVQAAPDAVVLLVSNPVDIMTSIARALHPNPSLVMGSGTILDSARFRQLIGERAGVNARYVHSYVMGEHGDSSVMCWSGALIAGMPVATFMSERQIPWDDKIKEAIAYDVRNAALAIIAGKHATYYGIGIAVNSLADAIINDRHAVFTVSGDSPFDEVCLSLPRLVGRKGILETLMPPLNKDESVALSHSAQVLYDAQEGVLKDGKLVCL
ncbi:L-lactate dehydrogenase [uncultured Cardiobacterium sp.]|uniref:L-lactate dehydrogenase n=1 Tax=uncultured Cardiobacterium sp. TaxID=417619 RepID=UPI00260D924F|nr:L-lactate dehydrogenase [uncultured Cardiobacterium sp.]